MQFIDKYSVSILDSLPEGVYIIDKEFKIQFVNKAAAQITEIEPDEVIGNLCRSFCKSERCEVGCPITEVLRTNKNVIDLESTILNKCGEPIPIILNASVLKSPEGEALGGIISFKKNRKIASQMNLPAENKFCGIVGHSKKMMQIFNLIKEISDSYATVLITGETGVGKELIADAIHKKSKRSDAPFVKVNCAVLPGTLLASELFGHVKGAFTDARADRVGRFELADGGTIFLDEIGEMPIEMQAQLLRVLQDGSFERLGDSKTIRTDVRIIAATNKNLPDEIKKKRFREDLYYRLNVVPIHIPPLRERRDDIVYLIDYFIGKFNRKYGRSIEKVDDDTMDILYKYDWPGNVRELENVIEYAYIRTKREDYICACTLPPELRANRKCADNAPIKEVEIDEKTETLLTLLRQNDWNKSKVAEILGVNRSTIHRRLKKLNIEN